MQKYHEPVMLEECIRALQVRKQGIYVDVTFGGGGHSVAILNELGVKGRLLAFDRDPDAAENVPQDSRFRLIPHNYRFLKNYLKYYQALPVDGILADLGVSSHQIDEADRGFSTRVDMPLDLRMDRRRGQTAEDLINTASEEDLKFILKQYGELDNVARIAGSIIETRQKQRIRTSGDLKLAVRRFMPRGREQKFLAKLFQALRIEVNQELESLRLMLSQCLDALVPGGRLVVLSYHSLEDRLVKNFMRSGNFEGVLYQDPIYGQVQTPFQIISRKAIVATESEIARNPRARSAKLRIAEKI